MRGKPKTLPQCRQQQGLLLQLGDHEPGQLARREPPDVPAEGYPGRVVDPVGRLIHLPLRIVVLQGRDHPAKVLAACGPQEVLEGLPVEGVVLVEVQSIEAARAWHNGPGCRAAHEYRFRGADYRAVIVEGV